MSCFSEQFKTSPRNRSVPNLLIPTKSIFNKKTTACEGAADRPCSKLVQVPMNQSTHCKHQPTQLTRTCYFTSIVDALYCTTNGEFRVLPWCPQLLQPMESFECCHGVRSCFNQWRVSSAAMVSTAASTNGEFSSAAMVSTAASTNGEFRVLPWCPQLLQPMENFECCHGVHSCFNQWRVSSAAMASAAASTNGEFRVLPWCPQLLQPMENFRVLPWCPQLLQPMESFRVLPWCPQLLQPMESFECCHGVHSCFNQWRISSAAMVSAAASTNGEFRVLPWCPQLLQPMESFECYHGVHSCFNQWRVSSAAMVSTAASTNGEFLVLPWCPQLLQPMENFRVLPWCPQLLQPMENF